MKIRYALAFAALAAPTSAVAQDLTEGSSLPVFEFMEQTTDAERTMTTLQGSACSQSNYNEGIFYCHKDYAQFTDFSLISLDVEFYENRLYRVIGAFFSLGFNNLAEAFTAKYGEPSASETRQWQSRAGAVFDNQVLIWQFRGGTLELRQRGSQVDYGSFMFRSQENAPPPRETTVDF